MAAINASQFKGCNITVRPGDHFSLLLPCGTLLQVEQTGDDFSITRGNGLVAYTKPTSRTAIASDGAKCDETDQTTGRN